MLRHNKSIALETLDEENQYTVIDEQILILNETAFDIYLLCDGNDEVTVIEKYLTNHIKGDVRKIDIISDIVEMIKKLIDMNLIIVED